MPSPPAEAPLCHDASRTPAFPFPLRSALFFSLVPYSASRYSRPTPGSQRLAEYSIILELVQLSTRGDVNLPFVVTEGSRDPHEPPWDTVLVDEFDGCLDVRWDFAPEGFDHLIGSLVAQFDEPFLIGKDGDLDFSVLVRERDMDFSLC